MPPLEDPAETTSSTGISGASGTEVERPMDKSTGDLITENESSYNESESDLTMNDQSNQSQSASINLSFLNFTIISDASQTAQVASEVKQKSKKFRCPICRQERVKIEEHFAKYHPHNMDLLPRRGEGM